MPKLYELREELERLYEQAFCESGDDGAVPQEIAEAMSKTDLDFDSKVEECLYVIRSWESDEMGFKLEEDRLSQARQRIVKRREALKNYVRTEMERIGKEKVRGAVLSCRLQKNSQPSVTITDESKVPEQYIRIVREVDKQLIIEATKRKENVEGVVVAVGKHLRITE